MKLIFIIFLTFSQTFCSNNSGPVKILLGKVCSDYECKCLNVRISSEIDTYGDAIGSAPTCSQGQMCVFHHELLQCISNYVLKGH